MPEYQVTIAKSLEDAQKYFVGGQNHPDNNGTLTLYWGYVKDKYKQGATLLKVITEPKDQNRVANLKLVDQDKNVIAKYQNSPDPETD